MKKIIAIEILLVFILAVLISVIVPYMKQTITWFGDVKWHIDRGDTPHYLAYQYAYTGLAYSIFSILASIADIAVIVIVAIQNFKFFQPLIEKYNQRKQERIAAREHKAATDKQKRIEELQDELNELQQSDHSLD